MQAHKLLDMLLDAVARQTNPHGDSNKRIRDRITRIERAVKFDFGDHANIPASKTRVFSDLPFENCYMEMHDSVGRPVALSLVQRNREILGEYFGRCDNRIPRPTGVYFRINLDENAATYNNTYKDEIKDQCARDCIHQDVSHFFHAIEVLNCSNVVYLDIAPSRLKQGRIKKGKTPLFTYKTLHIKTGMRDEQKNHAGGTHASPRVHLRRGHIRTLASGKTTWVQPCVVGDKSKGIVHKDYSVH